VGHVAALQQCIAQNTRGERRTDPQSRDKFISKTGVCNWHAGNLESRPTTLLNALGEYHLGYSSTQTTKWIDSVAAACTRYQKEQEATK